MKPILIIFIVSVPLILLSGFSSTVQSQQILEYEGKEWLHIKRETSKDGNCKRVIDVYLNHPQGEEMDSDAQMEARKTVIGKVNRMARPISKDKRKGIFVVETDERKKLYHFFPNIHPFERATAREYESLFHLKNGQYDFMYYPHSGRDSKIIVSSACP